MKRIRKDILNGKVSQQLLLFFIPVLLTYVLNQLYNTVDAMIVGKFVGTIALAAVGGSTGTSIGLITNFVLGLSSGITVIVAQYYGKGDNLGVNSAVKTGFFMAVILGLFMTILGILITPVLLRALNVPADMFPLSEQYMIVYLLGMIPTLVYNVGASILRAIGDSKRPLYFLCICAIVNVSLDYIFVAIAELGVFGAALATVISQIISAILVLIVFSKTEECLSFHLRDFGFDMSLLKKTISLGFPAGIQAVVYSLSNLYIQSCVNSFGTITVAAYTTLDKIDGFFWNYSGALGIAVTTIVGQNFGAGKLDRVKKTVRVSSLMYAIGCLFFTGICIVFAFPLISLFSEDIEVIEAGVALLRYLSRYWILFLCIEVFSSSMKACGDVLVPMFISIFGIACTRLIYLMVYPFTTVTEALRCYPLSWIITTIAFVIYCFRGSWMKRRSL